MILPERNYSKEGKSIILRIWGVCIAGLRGIYKPQDRVDAFGELGFYNHS